MLLQIRTSRRNVLILQKWIGLSKFRPICSAVDQIQHHLDGYARAGEHRCATSARPTLDSCSPTYRAIKQRPSPLFPLSLDLNRRHPCRMQFDRQHAERML